MHFYMELGFDRIKQLSNLGYWNGIVESTQAIKPKSKRKSKFYFRMIKGEILYSLNLAFLADESVKWFAIQDK